MSIEITKELLLGVRIAPLPIDCIARLSARSTKGKLTVEVRFDFVDDDGGTACFERDGKRVKSFVRKGEVSLASKSVDIAEPLRIVACKSTRPGWLVVSATIMDKAGNQPDQESIAHGIEIVKD